MNSILRNILAVIAGLFIGGVVNMGIIMISSAIIPPPQGTNLTTVEGIKAALPLMEPKHFIMPFLAHAIGTFVGALVTVLIAASHKMMLALTIAIITLAGGISAVAMIPAPMWFNVLDLVMAYIPMGYLAAKLLEAKQVNTK